MISRDQNGLGRTPVYRVLAALLRPLLTVLVRPRWSGAEHLPSDVGYIVAANHMCNLDPVTTAHFLYLRGRAPKIMAKHSLWKVPVLGWFLRHTGMIPVHRHTAGAADSLVAARAALEAGECVLIFPEGTFTQDPESWPMSAKTGVARLALTTGAPVVPVAHWGEQRILPPGGWPRPSMRRLVTVRAGKPVDLDDLRAGPYDSAAYASATQRVMDSITAILEDLRREKAPDEYDVRRRRRVRVRVRPQRSVEDAA